MRITNVESVSVRMPRTEADEALREKYQYVPKFFDAGLLRVSTDEGITGYGFSWLDPGYVERSLKPALLGRDPLSIEQLLEERVLPAVAEHALWDIAGKAARQPVYKLLGGHKDKVRAYVTCVWAGKPDQTSVTPEQQAKDAVHYLENGFKGIKIRSWRPKPEQDLDAAKAVRDAVGDEMSIMVDRTAHHPGWVWDHHTALKMARGYEKYDVAWLEEPLDRNDLDGLAELSRAVDIPITGGEAEHGIYRFKEILEKRSLDIVQPDAYTSGGILTVKKIASIAEAFGKPCILHGSNGFGLAAPLQAIGALPNCPWLEVAIVSPPFLPWEQWEPLTPLLKGGPLFNVEDGYVKLPDRPGLGVDLDEEALKRYAPSLRS
ncbi:MAG: mandelate racemase/muconate lactonizing enzyme family protein [Candidatus Bathyarchaeia archaeon]